VQARAKARAELADVDELRVGVGAVDDLGGELAALALVVGALFGALGFASAQGLAVFGVELDLELVGVVDQVGEPGPDGSVEVAAS
jgi:hypothetical protein